MLNIHVLIAKVKDEMRQTRQGELEMNAELLFSHSTSWVNCAVDIMFSSNLHLKTSESGDEFGLLGKHQSQEVEWIGNN